MDFNGVHHKTHAASTNIIIKISLFGLTLVSLNGKLFCVTLPHQLSWLLRFKTSTRAPHHTTPFFILAL